MKNQKYKILLLEDMISDMELIKHEIQKAEIKFSIKHVITKQEFQKELKNFQPDIILSDYLLPKFDGMAALKMVMEESPDIPFILVTGSINEETAVDSIKAGAADYVTKEHLGRLIPSIKGAIDKMKTEKTLQRQTRIFNAVHFTAHQFLKKTNWKNFINEVLERLGNAVDVSRVSIFENHTGQENHKLTSLRYEWVMPGIIPQIDNPDLQNIPRPPAGRDPWWDTLRDGDIIAGHVKDFLPKELMIMMSQDIVSMLIVPIFIGKEWWGFLSFDECKTERLWSNNETEELKTAADTIGLTLQQRFAKEALQKSEEQYRTLVEFSPMGVISIDTDGKINSVNSKLLEILGLSSNKTTININLFEYKPLSESGISSAFQSVLESGDTIESEAEYKSKKIKSAYLRYIITAISSDNGEIIGAQANIEDITMHKQMEEQLRHAQKLETITTLTGGIAHDFNNILGTIFGSVEMLQLLLPKDHPAGRYAKTIMDRSQKAANLVNQMVAYSRQQHLDPMPLNINRAIEELLMFLSRALEERIKLKLKLAENLKPVNGDKTAIDQILMNLYANATDAMKEGGTLTIRTENLDNIDKYVEKQPDIRAAQYILLHVTDTGHGITPEDREHIFEPFFTTKEVGKGTGLGLSMVYGLVKQHEGYIFCQSKVGKGTSFEVLFPAIDKKQLIHEKKSSGDQLHHGGGTIMLVEDEKDLVEILEVMLTELGYDIITTFDGEKALEIFKTTNKQIDLVITDIIMPNMGGKKLYREVTKINPNVKIVFISGYTNRGFYKKYDLEPDMKFLRKPFRLKEVSDLVSEVLSND